MSGAASSKPSSSSDLGFGEEYSSPSQPSSHTHKPSAPPQGGAFLWLCGKGLAPFVVHSSHLCPVNQQTQFPVAPLLAAWIEKVALKESKQPRAPRHVCRLQPDFSTGLPSATEKLLKCCACMYRMIERPLSKPPQLRSTCKRGGFSSKLLSILNCIANWHVVSFPAG